MAEILRTWLEAQLADERDRVRVSEAWGQGTANPESKGVTEAVPLDQVIVFNRSHLKLFSKSPLYRDLFTYVNAYGQTRRVLGSEAAESLGLPAEAAALMLGELSELGVLEEGAPGEFFASKRLFYFPDDAEFFELRRRNLEHNLDAVLERTRLEDLSDKKAYRQVVSRELSEEQVKELVGRLEGLAHTMLMQPEQQASTVYSLCMVFGARFSRAEESVVAPGLKTDKRLVAPQEPANASKWTEEG